MSPAMAGGLGDDRSALGARGARHVRDTRHAQRHAGAGHEVAGEEVRVGEDGRVARRAVAPGEGQRDDEEHVEGQVHRGAPEDQPGMAHQRAELERRLALTHAARGAHAHEHPHAGDDRHREHRPAERLLAGRAHQAQEDHEAGPGARDVRAGDQVEARADGQHRGASRGPQLEHHRGAEHGQGRFGGVTSLGAQAGRQQVGQRAG
jgi:hypothetical protein